MVNPGKPSRACTTCKLRRIKCDLTRPACNRCRTAGRQCPGVLDDSDVSFINQTATVAVRAQKTVSRRSPGADDPESPDSEEAMKILSRIAQSYRQLVWHREDGFVPKPPSLVKELVITKESQAVSLFFEHFVISPVGSKFMNPTLECLTTLYPSTSPSNPLYHMIAAAALLILSQYDGFDNARTRATATYGKALRSISAALQDKKKARENSTLMAIMIATLYETMLSTQKSLTGYRGHLEGAAALLRLRSDEQHPDEMTAKLFRLVRTELIMDRHPQLGQVPVTMGPTESNSFRPSNLPNSPWDRLFDMAVGIPDLMKSAESILVQPDHLIQSTAIFEVLELARHYDASLVEWSSTLPLDYGFTSVPALDPISPGELEQAPMWPGAVHQYSDIFIANLFNHYRVLRMYVATVIMHCALHLSILEPASAGPSPISENVVNNIYHSSIYALRSIVDDICASVPFHMGLSPAAGPGYFGIRTKMSTAAMGGYFLIRPLFIASMVDCIPREQLKWIKGRLKAIADYGFGQAMILGMLKATERQSDRPTSPFHLDEKFANIYPNHWFATNSGTPTPHFAALDTTSRPSSNSPPPFEQHGVDHP